jgi:hypothetical protein
LGFTISLLKELDSFTTSVTASATSSGKDAFFTQAGLALAVYCQAQEQQQELALLSMMTLPEKKIS